jgi:hypothetical protein
LGTLFIGLAIGDFSHLVLQEGHGLWWDQLSYGLWWDAVFGVILTTAAVACVSGGLRVFRRGSVDQNFLLLDDDGLTYLLWGVRRQWAWRQLPGFHVTKTFIFRHKVINFAVPDAVDWRARLGLRPGTRVSSGNLLALIADAYDRPLDEIAARLNEYRDTATN